MFSVRWAAELRFRGRAEGAYCLGLEGGNLADGTAKCKTAERKGNGNTGCTRVTGRENAGIAARS